MNRIPIFFTWCTSLSFILLIFQAPLSGQTDTIPYIQINKLPVDTVFFYKACTNLQNDLIYIPYHRRNTVMVLDQYGNKTLELMGSFENAIDLACTDSSIFILDEAKKEVIAFDRYNSISVHRIGINMPEKLKKPVSIGIIGGDQLFLFDRDRIKVHFFDLQGNLLRSIQLNGIVDPLYMLGDEEASLYVYDKKLDAIIKYDLNGKPIDKLQCDESKPGDHKGTIHSMIIDPLKNLLVFNESKNHIEWYDWRDSLSKIKVSSAFYNLSNVDHVAMNPKNLYINYLLKDTKFRASIQSFIQVPAPPNHLTFDINHDRLQVSFEKLKVNYANKYGLNTTTDQGLDTMIYLTREDPFMIDESNAPTMRSRRYKLVAMNPSSHSQPTEGFENYFGLAMQFKNQNQRDEAMLAFQNQLKFMQNSPAMVEYVALQILEIGSELLFKNIHLIKGLEALKKSATLYPASYKVCETLQQGYHYFLQKLAVEDNYTLIIEEASRAVADTLVKKTILQTLDSIAVDLAKHEVISDLANARLLRLKLLDWAPAVQNYWQSAYNVNQQLYWLKLNSGAPDYELQALNAENERYALKLIDFQQTARKPYAKEYLSLLTTLSQAPKYVELEAQCKKALTMLVNYFDADQILMIRELLAQALIGQKKNDQAIQEYNTLMSNKPGEARYKLGLANVLFANNDIPDALVLFKQLLLNDHENPALLYKAGLSELSLSNFTNAAMHLENAIIADNTNKTFYGPLGEAYEGSNNFQKAAEYYQLAVQYFDQLNNNSVTWKNKELNQQGKFYQEKLARLYQQMGLLEQAGDIFMQLTKANPKDGSVWFGLGSVYLSRGLIYEATKAFQVAMNLDASRLEYKMAYQNSIDMRSEASKNNDPLSITEVVIHEIYPSLYLNYGDASLLSLGSVTFTNNTPWPISLTQFSLEVDEYMKEPTAQNTGVIVGFSNQTMNLHALFLPGILAIDQRQSLQATVTAAYTFEGTVHTLSKVISITIHTRNTINWTDKRTVTSFIHVGDGPIADFSASCLKAFNEAGSIQLPEPIAKAAQIYSVLFQRKLKYTQDPDLNFSVVSTNTNILDYLQYPEETLMKGTGDCDDLVTLYCSLLENAGIATAFIDVPGHIFMAFELNITQGQVSELGFDPAQVITANGKVWLPIETTLIGEASFAIAWESAGKKYRQVIAQGTIPDLVPNAEARKIFRPSAYHISESLPTLDVTSELIKEYTDQMYNIFGKLNERLLIELKNQQVYQPDNVFIKNKYAILLAQAGRLTEAKQILIAAARLAPGNASIQNNLGNITLQDGNYEEAITYFVNSYQINPSNLRVVLNLVKANIKAKNKEGAQKWIDLAASITTNNREYEYYRAKISQL